MTTSLTQSGIPYEHLDRLLTLQDVRDKCFELSRERAAYGPIRGARLTVDVWVSPELHASLLKQAQAVLWEPGTHAVVGEYFKFDRANVIRDPRLLPGMCVMPHFPDIFCGVAENPKFHWAWLGCHALEELDWQI